MIFNFMDINFHVYLVMGIPCSSCKIDLRQAEDDTSINGYN